VLLWKSCEASVGGATASQVDSGRLTDRKAGEPGGYWEMDQILPPELNDLEFKALCLLAAHPAACHIPSGVETRLKDIGYLREVLGGIVLTKDGLQRISEGK
jgi:hypothetical protein